MPAPSPRDSPNRLRLGQGVAGGSGALPQLGVPNPTPRPPAGLPHIPAQAPAARINQPAVSFSGPGYAQDVTPAPLAGGPLQEQAPQYKGEAYLRRFGNELGPREPLKVGKGLQKTMKILSSPDTAWDPANKKQLNLIMKPGPQVQAMIDTDPHLKANQQALQNHVMTNGPRKLPAQDLIKKLHNSLGTFVGPEPLSQFMAKHKAEVDALDPEAKHRFAQAAYVAMRTQAQKNPEKATAIFADAGQPSLMGGTNIIENAMNQGIHTVTGMVPGTYQLARHPKEAIPAMVEATKQYYSPLFHGDFGQFAHNVNEAPLTLGMDLAAGYGAVAGTAGRVGALADATSAWRVANTVEDLGNGAARVGNRYTLHPMQNGRYMMRDSQTNKLIGNMPDADTAVAHAKSLSFEGAHRSAFGNAVRAYTHPELYGKGRGAIIDNLQKHSEKARAARQAEDAGLIDELKAVADDPNIRPHTFSRSAMRSSVHQAKSDIGATVEEMKATHGPTQLAAQTYRELISGVRHGAIYARLGYLPNNWAGNTFMNLTHQGFLAPINLAKSVVVHNHMKDQNLAMMRKATGMNPAQAAAVGAPRGVVTSVMHPIVEAMGKLADQPFRDAAFLHEARRMGYNSMSDVDHLFDTARAGGARGEEAYAKIARMGNRAQEEVVKFKELNPTERALATNMLFVWNWVRGSARYAARFPLQHPIQGAAYTHAAPIGNSWVDKQTGGMPWFMAGSIPVGRKANGDPIMINPFALNPLGTSVQLGRDVMGSIKALTHPEDFNKYADSTLLDLTNPVIQEAIKAFTGQHVAPVKDIGNQIAPVKLYQDWQHPGRGSLYPMSRTEAVGHNVFGALFPRRASQEAITRALERQNSNNPAALLDMQVKDYEKTTGQKVDPFLISKVKGDYDQLQMIKDFQRKYADSKGSTGFKSLPAKNRGEAAIEYLRQHGHIPKSDLKDLEQAMAAAPSEAIANQLANKLWSLTNAGKFKAHWDKMKNQVKGTKTPTAPRK